MFDDFIFSNSGARKVDTPKYTVSRNYQTVVEESKSIQEYLTLTLKESMFLNWLMQQDIQSATKKYIKLVSEELSSENQGFELDENCLDNGKKSRNHSKNFQVKFPNKINSK